MPASSAVSWLARLALVAALLPASDGLARPMEGRLGVGLEQSLAGASGLGLRYFSSDTLAVAVTLGLDLAIGDDPERPGERSVAAGLATSLGVLWQLARSDHAHLGLGARLALGYRTLDARQLVDPAATASDLDLALELPLALEFWLSDHFSVTCATGLLLHLVPDSGAQLDGAGAGSNAPAGGVGVGLGAGAITATLGAFYYF
jgi:hypothetical protein